MIIESEMKHKNLYNCVLIFFFQNSSLRYNSARVVMFEILFGLFEVQSRDQKNFNGTIASQCLLLPVMGGVANICLCGIGT